MKKSNLLNQIISLTQEKENKLEEAYRLDDKIEELENSCNHKYDDGTSSFKKIKIFDSLSYICNICGIVE